MYNILDKKELSALKKKEQKRFKFSAEGGNYLDLRGAELKPIDGVDVERINNLARIVRGLAFAAIDGIKSGHPGGSSSKTEQVLTLLFSGILFFYPLIHKHLGEGRFFLVSG